MASKLDAFLAAVPANGPTPPSSVGKPSTVKASGKGKNAQASSALFAAVAEKLSEEREREKDTRPWNHQVSPASNQEEPSERKEDAVSQAHREKGASRALEAFLSTVQPSTATAPSSHGTLPRASSSHLSDVQAAGKKASIDGDEAGPLRRLASTHGYHHRRVSTDSAMFNRYLRKQAHRDIDESVVQHFAEVETVTLCDRSQEALACSASWSSTDDSEDNNETYRECEPVKLMESFRQGETIPITTALEIIRHATNAMTIEPNVLALRAPCTLVGDLHGQYLDLVEIFRVHGVPSESNQFLFLGDYVDRGVASCEIILLLLAFKGAFPQHIHLLRGNHECRSLSTFYGFRTECLQKYGPIVYNRIIQCFESMPLAALLTTGRGKFLAVHGGISPDIERVDEINDVNRFTEPEPTGALCDLLWADPSKEEGQERDWAPNSARGCSYTFNERVCRNFLQKNGLLSIIRAHELEEEGFREHFVSNDEENAIPPVITVFSAPEYCNINHNVGATLFIDSAGEYSYRQHKRSDEREQPFAGESEEKATIAYLKKHVPFLPLDFYDLVGLCRRLRSNSRPSFSASQPYEEVGNRLSDHAPVLKPSTVKEEDSDQGSDSAEKPTSSCSVVTQDNESHSSRHASRRLQLQSKTVVSIEKPQTDGLEERRRRRRVGGFILCPGLQTFYEWLCGRKTANASCNQDSDLKAVPTTRRSSSPWMSVYGNVHQECETPSTSSPPSEAPKPSHSRRRSLDLVTVMGCKSTPANSPPAVSESADGTDEEGDEDDVHAVTAEELEELNKLYRRSSTMTVDYNVANSTLTIPANVAKTNNINIFTNEQWQALRLFFGILDIEGNGVLMEESFVVLLAEQDNDAYATEEELELLLEQMDCNGDGLITEQDFLLFAYRAYLRWKRKNRV